MMHSPAISRDWVTTKHTWNGPGGPIEYTATCGFVPIKNDQTEETEAEMFFVAYTKDDATASKRPVTFAFNGGPGSSTVWLHMGAMAPLRAKMNEDGSLPAPPFEMVQNNESWLPNTDLVFVDAIGTGYSRPSKPELGTKFYGVRGDLAAFTDFIKGYLSEGRRWHSPIFVAGESYGGIRVAGLSLSLLRAGIAVNGIISISGVMNMASIDAAKDNDVPYIGYLPAECATAIYHHKVKSDNFHQTVSECEEFASGEYAAALMKGDGLSEEQRKHIAAKVASFIGISPIFVERSNLRVSPTAFRAELLRDDWDIVGRYDARLVGHNQFGTSQFTDYDPSDTAVTPVFTAAFGNYISEDLNFHTSELYRTVAYGQIGNWDYGDGRDNDTSEMLRSAMEQNPHMKVMLCCGWYDLACPYYCMRYVIDHLGEQAKLKKNIRFRYFPAGHMLYIDSDSRKMFAHEVSEFIKDATGPGR
jgi:carboxypeptidase C (cathepsin A)